MPEKTPHSDALKEYLERLRIQQKSTSVDDYSARLAHLYGMRASLAELMSRGYDVAEGTSFIGPRSQVGGLRALAIPDYVVFKEDVLLYIYLQISTPQQILAESMQAIWQALRENPNLSAAVAVWPEEGYPSVCIDSFLARTFVERAEIINVPGEMVLPLADAIDQFFESQFTEWNLLSLAEDSRKGAPSEGISSQLRSKLEEAFIKERTRNLGIPEKVEAQQRITSIEVKQLLERVLALVGNESISPSAVAEFREYVDTLSKA